MIMTRIRQLPDGRYVERDGSGVLYFVTPLGGESKILARNSEQYIALGLRSDLDDRALYNAMDPSTHKDPNVLVWDGYQGKYVPRGELSAPGVDPGGVVIGPHHEPHLTVPPVQQAPVTPPPKPVVAAATGVTPAPAPGYVPVPGPIPVPARAERQGLVARIRAWLRRVFG